MLPRGARQPEQKLCNSFWVAFLISFLRVWNHRCGRRARTRFSAKILTADGQVRLQWVKNVFSKNTSASGQRKFALLKFGWGNVFTCTYFWVKIVFEVFFLTIKALSVSVACPSIHNPPKIHALNVIFQFLQGQVREIILFSHVGGPWKDLLWKENVASKPRESRWLIPPPCERRPTMLLLLLALLFPCCCRCCVH